ncbi:MAG: type II toxin-antitoxin system death-on-curing family toxin [Candidatus Aenigmarchaeota archaeon]|nr:type II toxin-antitoxin system death-on-curing family toxin [Candidatus Aenigmarchaeota archaeon]
MTEKHESDELKLELNDGTRVEGVLKNGIFYPAPSFVIWLHEVVAGEGLRDKAGLDIICYKTQENRYPKIIDKSSFLLHSIATKHPFYNGNKRTALMAALVFLVINGYGIDIVKQFNDEETKNFMLDVAKYEKSVKEVSEFSEKKLKNIERQ